MSIDTKLLDACVHCGLCLDACPTFVETGREEESPRGRLFLMSGLVEGRWTPEDALPHLDRCLGCRACESACPSGVQYGRILEETRAWTATQRKHPRSRVEWWLVRRILWRGDLLETWARGYRTLRVERLARALSRAPILPAAWRSLFRLAPPVESKATYPSVPADPRAPRALLLRGCVARAFFPRTEDATAYLLGAAGYRVERAGDPPCCGALAHHLGARDLSLRLGKQLMDKAGDEGILVTTAAGCGAHLRGLGHAFPEDPRATRLASRVRDIGEALLEAPRALRFQKDPATRAAFQEPCHLVHGLRGAEAQRTLLDRAGVSRVPFAGEHLCCGSAGTYNVGEARMGERLGRNKAVALMDARPDVVVTSNPGCALQIAAHLGGALPVVSLPVLLAERALSPEKPRQR